MARKAPELVKDSNLFFDLPVKLGCTEAGGAHHPAIAFIRDGHI